MITFGYISEQELPGSWPTLIVKNLNHSLVHNSIPKQLPQCWVVIDSKQKLAISSDNTGIKYWTGFDRKWEQMNGSGWKLMKDPTKGLWWRNDWNWEPKVENQTITWHPDKSEIRVQNDRFMLHKNDTLGYIPDQFYFIDIYDYKWEVKVIKRHIWETECQIKSPNQVILLGGFDRIIHPLSDN